MAYCTLDELKGFLPRYEITDDTAPSNQDCTDFITRVSARIDSIVSGTGLAVPVSGAISLQVLKVICLNGAGWYATRIMFPNAQTGLVQELRTEYELMLSQIMVGTMALPDATSDSQNQILTTSNTYQLASSCPFISRDTQF